MQNYKHKKITVADMSPHVHNFLSNENKVDKILKWMIQWIESSLECGKINPKDMLPSKADLAFHIGVSQGTIQNVYRLLEDAGYVESKQRIGTCIKNPQKNNVSDKLTSKRELAIEIIKKYIIENNYKINDVLISARKLASITGLTNATIRLAMINLVNLGILKKKNRVFIVSNIDFKVKLIESTTLVEKISQKLSNYIKCNFKAGDKLPSNTDLAKIHSVSVKTIHDAIKILAKEGVLHARRGKYGTIVVGNKNNEMIASYFYEKIEQKIKSYISENSNIGDKLPAMREFAQLFQTSEKTVKKALDNLAEEGYVTFSRGRYGGTFVTDIPQASKDAYKWLALSSDYTQN